MSANQPHEFIPAVVSITGGAAVITSAGPRCAVCGRDASNLIHRMTSHAISAWPLYRAAVAAVASDTSSDGRTRWLMDLEEAALRFTAARIRDAGELGTERMAQFVESLIVNLRGDE
jgi:hypothetical protein